MATEATVAGAASVAAQPSGASRIAVLVHAVAVLGVLIQAATALLWKWITGEFGSWTLLIHMGGAGVFTVGLTGTALLWAHRCRFGEASGLNFGQKLMFWLAVPLGLTSMLTMLIAMLPVFGTDGQEILKKIHELAGMSLVVVMVVHTVVSLAAKRAQR